MKKVDLVVILILWKEAKSGAGIPLTGLECELVQIDYCMKVQSSLSHSWDGIMLPPYNRW